MLSNNLFATLITFLVAIIWLRLNDYLAHCGWISSDISRKIIHMGTGPLFVLCWLLFNDSPSSPFLAALVPAVITLQFILVGTGIIKDNAAVKAMSRTGDRREILRGPLFYGIVFILLTVFYWKRNPIGITALMLMCGGDGLADILGRRFGKHRLPWNPHKSWMGSLGMFIGGLIFAALILIIYQIAHIFSYPFPTYITALLFIALAGTIVESLPLEDIDNITVTVGSLILGHMLFK
jgi:phytol kinase